MIESAGTRQVALLSLALAAAGLAWIILKTTYNPGSQPPPQFLPISPITTEFLDDGVSNRIDYLITESNNFDDDTFRNNLRIAIVGKGTANSGKYHLYSLYTYVRGGSLGEGFAGDAASLRTHDQANLISYARWNWGALDMFYLINEGNVYFDLLRNQPVSPQWEFE